MNKVKLTRFPLFALAVIATAMIYVAVGNRPSQADEPTASTNMNEEELGNFVYNYLMENPGIIIEAVEKYRQNQAAEEEKLYDRKLSEYKDDLYEDDLSPSIGNPDADIVIVEFFDYNCGYCKKALNDVQALIKEDKNIRVIFKDMPILSPASRMASLWALAANKQGKYWEYHVALMKHSGSKSESALEKLATNVGLDIEQLKQDVKDPALEKTLDNNLAMSRDLGIRGTPAFIINDILARGYIGLDSMKDTIKNLRADKG